MGTRMMSAEEVGAYIRLLCHQWDTGYIPNHDNTICRLCGIDQSRFSHVWLNLLSKFQLCEDGYFRNPRLEQERAKQKAYREKQSENANKRWVGNAKLMPPHMPNGCSPSPSPTSKKNTLVVRAAPALPDSEWLSSLESDPAYKGVPVSTEIAKCRVWCSTSRKPFSRRRIISWLNRVERPVGYDSQTRFAGGFAPNVELLPLSEPDGWSEAVKGNESLGMFAGRTWAGIPEHYQKQILNICG